MGERKYSTIQQHEPLRIPSTWSHQERRFVAQLEEILDDMYRRFNRIKLSDLGSELKETVVSSADGVENMETQVSHANEQIKAVSDQQSDLTERLSSTESKTEEAIARIDLTYESILQQIIQNGETMTQINATVDGIDAWSKDTEGNLADLLLAANAIKAQVSSVEGDVGKMLLTNDEFRTTLQSGDTVLSEIRQRQDEISQIVYDGNGTIGALTVKADDITGKITSAENKISQLMVKTDGMIYTLEQDSEALALFEVNQQHMLTQIGSAASSIGSIEVTANAITQKVEDVSKGVGQFQVTADRISGSVQDLDGRVGKMELTSDQFKTTITGLDGRVGKLELTDDQFKTTITGLDGRVGELELRSDSFDVAIGKDGLGGKISMIEGLLQLEAEAGGNTVSVKLDAMDDAIELKADTTYVDKLVADSISAATGSFGSLLAGYVKTKELEAVKASFDELLAGYVTTKDFEAVEGWTENFSSRNIDADVIGCGQGNFDELVVNLLNGENCVWASKTVMTGIQSITQNKRFLTLMKGDGTTVTLDIVTDVSITPSRSTIDYLAKN